MRLFGKVDGTIDRFDRAGWLTLPFDLAFAAAVVPAVVVRRGVLLGAAGQSVALIGTAGQADLLAGAVGQSSPLRGPIRE